MLGVGTKAYYDYRTVSDGGSAYGFAELKDRDTGEPYGHLSSAEVKELLALESQHDAAIADSKGRITQADAQKDVVILGKWLLENGALKGTPKFNEVVEAKKRAEAVAAPDQLLTSSSSGSFDPDAYLAEAQARDDAIKARLVVSIKVGDLMWALLTPLLCFWTAFFTIRWVVAGFRNPT
jgi:hypothetical protein